MTVPVLAPPTPGLSILRLEIALLCLHVLTKHGVEIPGLGARELLAWAGVPEEHLTPLSVDEPSWRRPLEDAGIVKPWVTRESLETPR